MKKVLFVLQSIGYGGSMTSMINLLRFMSRDKDIDIDVQFMDRYGELLEEAETVSHVLAEDSTLQSVTMRRNKIISMKRYDLYAQRCVWAIEGKMKGVPTSTVAYKKTAQKYSDRYDCVVAFQEGVATNFVKYISSPRKIAWVHTEYDKLVNLYPDIDTMKEVYSAFDEVVCVSNTCKRHFADEIMPKVCCIHNTIPTEIVCEKAKANIVELLDVNIHKGLLSALENRHWKFISSGRYSKEKRFDRLVEVAEKLKMAKVDFVWLVLGQGEEFAAIQELVREKKLEEYVFLLGATKNPFPFVSAGDMFVLTSDYEAQPMVANEALSLGIPVITTNYESSKEVVEHGVNGMICNMSSESIFQTITTLVNDERAFERLVCGAREFRYCNDEIVKKVHQLLIGGGMPDR